jgi:hypothetical protein
MTEGAMNLKKLILCLSLIPAATSAQSRGPIMNDRVSSKMVSAEMQAAARQRVIENYGRLPLSFEANQGQTGPDVRFLSRGDGYSLFLTSNEAVLYLKKPGAGIRAPLSLDPGTAEKPWPAEENGTFLRMKLLGANTGPQVTGLDELPGKSNYYIGNDPQKWRTNVPTYAKVRYENVYKGIDLIYYGNQRQLEFDFVVAPGADPRTIRLAFDGTEKPRIDGRGEIVLAAGGGEIRLNRPVVYQEVNGARKSVGGAFVIRSGGEVGWAGDMEVWNRLVLFL